MPHLLSLFALVILGLCCVSVTFSLSLSRRRILRNSLVGVGAGLLGGSGSRQVAVAASPLDQLQSQLVQARSQLDVVPNLIENQKWDSVRAILITPPLSDVKKEKSLAAFAEALGGDEELDALEFKEDAMSHLRYLDMAVYNNNFNPIASEGESGATKELIRSYYEDPVNEYKASIQALDGLIQLGKNVLSNN